MINYSESAAYTGGTAYTGGGWTGGTYTTKSKIDKIKDRESSTVVNKDIRRNSKQTIDYTMDGSVKQLFLNLTKMQIPFNYEHTLEQFFPNGMKKDDHGNYYIIIGESKTMFCGHLDTYCYEYKRVWHVIEDNIIKTDGTTTLGGDDKAGITIMIKMIESNVPGLYYFFRGEEGVTSPNGTWGSKEALKSYKDFFKDYKRCIAFDRKANDSIITKQMYSECCSTNFTNKLIEGFKENGLSYRNDTTGMWCDSGVFMELIPECTNISIGYSNEHTFNESQDIEHLEKLVEACINIKWDELPVERDPSVKTTYGRGSYGSYGGSYGYGGYGNFYDDDEYYTSYSNIKPRYIDTKKFNNKQYNTMKELFLHVTNLLMDLGYEGINNETFSEGEEMYFLNNKNSDFFGLKIYDYDIFINTDDKLTTYEFIGNIDSFEEYVRVGDKKYSEEKEEEEEDDLFFTSKQNRIFKKFVEDDVVSLNMIMYAIVNNKDNELTSDEWLKVEYSMINNQITIDYNVNGINPDDLTDWVSANWEDCKKITDNFVPIGKNKKDDKVIKEKLRSGLNNIFTTKQINTFTDISLNKKPKIILSFIQQVIETGILDNEDNYKKYETSVSSWITSSDYKITNEIAFDSFLDWLIYNYKDIKEYNGI